MNDEEINSLLESTSEIASAIYRIGEGSELIGGSSCLVVAFDRLSDSIMYGLKWLGNGDASTPMGAIEAHGKAITDAGERIADSISELAEAIAIRLR